MGQYHLVVNLDKKEFLNPHKLGCGLKLWEQLANHPSTGTALIPLLACSNGRGGGDLQENPLIGRWAGDRIAIIGDYAEETDLPKKFRASAIYDACRGQDEDDEGGAGYYKDITEGVCELLEKELEGKFKGDGWRSFEPYKK